MTRFLNCRRSLGCACVLLLTATVSAAPIPVAEIKRAEPVDFEKEVLPLLQRNCLACHSTSEKQGDLVLETPEGMRKGGDSGPAILPGRGAQSLLVKLAAHQSDRAMPPPGNDVNAKALTSQELGLLKLWIDQGARGGNAVVLSPKIWQLLPNSVGPVYGLALTADGQYVAATRGNRLYLYHVPSGQEIAELTDPATVPATVPGKSPASATAHRDLVESLAFHVDGDLLASGGFREVKLWRRPRDVQLANFPAGVPVTALAVSPDRRWIATPAANHTIRCWNLADQKAGPTCTGHTGPITALKYSSDGTRLISAAQDQTVRVWNPTDGASVGVMETTAVVNTVELISMAVATEQQPSPPQLLVTGGADNLLRTWTLPAAPPVKLAAVPANLQLTSLSPDRRYLALCSADGTLRVLRDVRQAQDALPRWEAAAEWKPDGMPLGVTFVPVPGMLVPGKRDAPATPHLATLTKEGTISVWSIPNHQLLARWLSGEAIASALTASADGKTLATGAESGVITSWNLSVDAEVEYPGKVGGSVTHLAVSPSGLLTAAACMANGKPAVVVRNLENGQITHTFTGHDGPIRAVAFSADNTRLITGSEDKTVRLWNLANATVSGPVSGPARLEGHAAAVVAVAFSPDGKQVLSGTADNAVRLWNPEDGSVIKDFAGHTGPILCVGFVAVTQPFSVSTDRSVRFWNPADGAVARTFSDQGTPVGAVLGADAQQIALLGNDKQVRLYQMNTGQLLKTIISTLSSTTLAFSADGKRFLLTAAATANQPGISQVWDIEANVPRPLEGVGHPALSTAVFAKQTDRIELGTTTGVQSRHILRFIRHFDGNLQAITALRYHSNGQTLFATAKDGSFRGYATGTGQPTFNTNHGAAIHALALSPNEQWLATAGENAVVRLWQVNGAPYGPQQLTGFAGPVKSVAFSPDGTKVIAGSAGEKPAVLVFGVDQQTGAVQQRFTGHEQPLFSIVDLGAEDASHVLSASSDGVWHWSVQGVRQYPGHAAAVTTLAADPAVPAQVYSGSVDATVRRWNLTNGQPIAQYNQGGAVTGVAIRPDGQRLAVVGENRLARLLNVNGQQIAELSGDVRLKTRVARLTQQQNATNQRLAIAKQRLDVAGKDLPVKTDAEKKAAETLATATKARDDALAAVKKTEIDKVAAEKATIEASTAARQALLVKSTAEQAAKDAATMVTVVQQKSAQLTAAANAAPNDANLKKAAADALLLVTAAQQNAQQMQTAIAAPTQAAQAAVTAANAAAQKSALTQTPYNDALSSLKKADVAQNLAAQQHVIAARELKQAQDLVPILKTATDKAETAAADVKKSLETATLESTAANLPLRAVAFAPDGRTLATAGDFPAIQTWDAETGTALAAYAGHASPVTAVTFLDDGRIASGSTDQSSRCWDLNPRWRLERVIGAVDRPDIISHRVTALDFSDDSKQILVGGGVPSRNGELHIFLTADGQRTLFLPQAHDDVVYAARFSPDGKRIASAGADKYLRTFDVVSGQQLRRFEGHTNYVLSVAWKGDAQTLVTAGADQTIKVWNSETGDQDRTIPNFGKQVTSVRYIGETDNIVSSCGDRIIRMFNAANGGLFRNLTGPSAWPHSLDVTPDGNVVATGTADGKIYLWNGNNGQPLKTIDMTR